MVVELLLCLDLVQGEVRKWRKWRKWWRCCRVAMSLCQAESGSYWFSVYQGLEWAAGEQGLCSLLWLPGHSADSSLINICGWNVWSHCKLGTRKVTTWLLAALLCVQLVISLSSGSLGFSTFGAGQLCIISSFQIMPALGSTTLRVLRSQWMTRITIVVWCVPKVTELMDLLGWFS